ncbi:MAG: mercuric reductase [Bacteroidia bacterium]
MSEDSIKPFDAIIIGSGQAGNPLASALADEGWKVAIIEAAHPGGSCINFGCTPTKTMIASARAAHVARNANKVGVHVGNVSPNLQKIVARKDDIVESFRVSTKQNLVNNDNISLIEGKAFFKNKNSVEVALNNGGRLSCTAEKIFINTGTIPNIPALKGLDEVPHHTSTTLLDVTEIPEHLVVLGGGYIGLELGQMYSRFGSEVTIIESGDQLMAKEDDDVAEEMKDILEGEEINVLLNLSVKSVSRLSSGKVKVHFDNNAVRDITCTHLLLATGRKPNTAELRLKNAGVQTGEHGEIVVNERLQTNVEGIYAVGDVKGGPMFTHISYDDFRVVRDNLLKNGSHTTNDRMLPYTVFTDPQLGRIGLSERQAREQGKNFEVKKLMMENSSRGVETNHTRGFLKSLVEKDTGKILGFAALSHEGGEIASMVQIAMMGGLKAEQLRDAIFSHPLYAESLNKVF